MQNVGLLSSCGEVSFIHGTPVPASDFRWSSPVAVAQMPRVSAPPPASPSSSPAPLFDVSDYARAAQAVLSPLAWAYLAGGAGDEITLGWNEESFQRLRLRPRALVDVSQLDTRRTLLGHPLPFPILLAPTAYQRLYHGDGELAAVRGAGSAGALYVASTSATTPLEEIAAARHGPVWFQLYVQRDRDLTAQLVRRAEAAGYTALVVTVDTPILGPRYRELRAGFTLPPGLDAANLRGTAARHRTTDEEIYSTILDASLTWKDLAWLRSLTRLPLVLKGIMDPDDAERALGAGAAALVVSNHGARNLDTSPATIDALPGIVARVAGRVPVLVDGGIRRGTDILKAVALGADAVLIGRPFVYGLAVNGAAGVAHIVQILRRELEMAMALTGKTTLAAVDRTALWDRP